MTMVKSEIFRKVFQLKLFSFHDKNTLYKTIILHILFLLCFINLSAQKENNIKMKIEAGILWDWVDGKIYLSGPFLNIEPKLKTSKNTFIGLRIGAAENTQRILTSDPNQFHINNENDNGYGNSVFSLVPTFDYYFSKNKLRPYLGVGIGYYFLTTSKDVFVIGKPFDYVQELTINNQIGFLLRGGFNLHKVIVGRFDLSKFTIGLEYNHVPKTDVEIPNGQVVGTVVTSNIAMSFGYTFGNRKRSK